MTRFARIGLAAALLLGGATFAIAPNAMAQNGPPTGGYPPARWNPNFGYYNYYARPYAPYSYGYGRPYYRLGYPVPSYGYRGWRGW
jgi:hypothetical protein